MQRPLKIGVLIACYNYERYVGAAINSVFAQTRAADEVIVVDDGSTDRSAAIVEGWFGERVKLIRQANAGQTVALRNGFAQSTADVIQFLDADDRLLPGALAAIERVWRDGTSKAQFDLEVIDGDGQRLGRRFCRFPAGYDAAAAARDFERTGTYPWPVTSGNAYARSFLTQAIGEPTPVSLDGVLNTLAPLYGTIETIVEPMGEYSIHGANKSHEDQGRSFAKPQFARRIDIRRAELALLADHCIRLDRPVPLRDPLDHEIAFVNYRMIAHRIHRHRTDSRSPGRFHFWKRGVTLGLRDGGGIRQRLSHVAWFSALFVAPQRVVGLLIDARYGRAVIVKQLGKALRWR